MNAPIIIFTYNRIENLKKLISSLLKNRGQSIQKFIFFLMDLKQQKISLKQMKYISILEALKFSVH